MMERRSFLKTSLLGLLSSMLPTKQTQAQPYMSAVIDDADWDKFNIKAVYLVTCPDLCEGKHKHGSIRIIRTS